MKFPRISEQKTIKSTSKCSEGGLVNLISVFVCELRIWNNLVFLSPALITSSTNVDQIEEKSNKLTSLRQTWVIMKQNGINNLGLYGFNYIVSVNADNKKLHKSNQGHSLFQLCFQHDCPLGLNFILDFLEKKNKISELSPWVFIVWCKPPPETQGFPLQEALCASHSLKD